MVPRVLDISSQKLIDPLSSMFWFLMSIHYSCKYHVCIFLDTCLLLIADIQKPENKTRGVYNLYGIVCYMLTRYSIVAIKSGQKIL